MKLFTNQPELIDLPTGCVEAPLKRKRPTMSENRLQVVVRFKCDIQA